MPRKPKPGPPILKIEGLSTGIDHMLVNDFTGQPLVQPNARPPKIDDAQAYRDAQRRKSVDNALRVLEQAVQEPKAKAVGKLVRRI